MGEVKDAIKGTKTASAEDSKSLLAVITKACDELSRLIEIKDKDVEREGKEAEAENRRKAALLRACFSLLTAVRRLLEDY